MSHAPQELIPKEQAWFWTREWQRKEKEAESEIETGKLSGPFRSTDTMVKTLKMKKRSKILTKEA